MRRVMTLSMTAAVMAAVALHVTVCETVRPDDASTGVLRMVTEAQAPKAIRGRGRLQSFIESTRSYASLPRHAHKTDFRIVPVTDRKYSGKFFWFLDGEQKIGLLNLSSGEIEMFRFFPPATACRWNTGCPRFMDGPHCKDHS